MSIQQIPLGTAPYLGQPGCAFTAITTTPTVTAGTRFILPVGSFFIIATSGFDLEFQTGSGVWSNVGEDFSGWVWSDGTNVGLLNDSGGDTTTTYIQVR